MASRQTIPVEQIRDWANAALQTANSTLLLDNQTPEQAFRLGIAGMLERVLHATGNYAGFQYADPSTPGEYVTDVTDETRRRYL